MNVLQVTSIACLTIVTLIHLYASAKRDQRLRNISKPFIVPAIAFYYFAFSTSINKYLLLALLFAWIGDLLLIIKETTWLIVGGASFVIAHVFFAITFLPQTFPILRLLLLIAIFFSVALLAHSELRKVLSKNMQILAFIYLSINGLMNVSAQLRLMERIEFRAILTAVGALFFFHSDYLLFLTRFSKTEQNPSHYRVMLIYILGLILIVSGYIF